MKIRKIYNSVLFFVGAFVLTGCLKDDERFNVVDISTNKIVEITSAARLKSIALAFEDEQVTVTAATVSLAAKEPAAEDIPVTLTLENSQKIIDSYNETKRAANPAHKDVIPLPTTWFSLESPGLNVVIPKGGKSVDFKIKTNAINFNPSETYALGFNIKNFGKEGYLQSGNFDTILVTFGAKNKYDGVYTLSIRLDGTDRPTLETGVSTEWFQDVHLVTTSGTSVNLYDPGPNGFDDFIQPIITADGGLSAFGSTNPRFTFDLATDKIIAISNDFNGTRKFEIDPNGPNYYDPVEKVIYATYFMTQPNFQPLKISDVFEYVESRP